MGLGESQETGHSILARCFRIESDGLFTLSPWRLSLKNLPAMCETQVRFLGQEDPLKKEMATHSSILAWRIPGTEEPGGVTVHGVAKSQT